MKKATELKKVRTVFNNFNDKQIKLSILLIKIRVYLDAHYIIQKLKIKNFRKKCKYMQVFINETRYEIKYMVYRNELRREGFESVEIMMGNRLLTSQSIDL